jgi:hypothetical protein
MLIPIPISLFSILIGFFFPLGFIIAGVSMYVFCLYLSIILYFVKELSEKKGDEKNTPEEIRSWKRWLRYWSIPTIFFGFILMNSYNIESNEGTLGISFVGFGLFTLGLFMIFTSLRKYKTHSTEPTSSHQQPNNG